MRITVKAGSNCSLTMLLIFQIIEAIVAVTVVTEFTNRKAFTVTANRT